jgi:cytidine deaminase
LQWVRYVYVAPIVAAHPLLDPIGVDPSPGVRRRRRRKISRPDFPVVMSTILHRPVLLDAERELIAAAEQALTRAYAPYSSLRVGAALSTVDGAIVTGCNVENVAFPVGSCAERNAIAAAVDRFGPQVRLAAIAVAAQHVNGTVVAVTPCGACRQAIAELAAATVVIYRSPVDGDYRAVDIGALLPESFRF